MKCLDCEKQYFGQTKRKLEIRKAEHEADCRKKMLNDEKPLAKHAIENNHHYSTLTKIYTFSKTKIET